MNSKERVLAAFNHEIPDRTPMWYGAAPEVTQTLMRMLGAESEEALMQRLHIDFRRVRERYAGPELRSTPTVRASRFGASTASATTTGGPTRTR